MGTSSWWGRISERCIRRKWVGMATVMEEATVTAEALSVAKRV